jgi:Tfp pilus assembly protein PilN
MKSMGDDQHDELRQRIDALSKKIDKNGRDIIEIQAKMRVSVKGYPRCAKQEVRVIHVEQAVEQISAQLEEMYNVLSDHRIAAGKFEGRMLAVTGGVVGLITVGGQILVNVFFS